MDLTKPNYPTTHSPVSSRKVLDQPVAGDHQDREALNIAIVSNLRSQISFDDDEGHDSDPEENDVEEVESREKEPEGLQKEVGGVAMRKELARDKPKLTKQMKAKEKRKTMSDIKLTSGCPLCPKKFQSGWSVRRHLESTHKVEKKNFKNYEINSTKKRCKYCNFFFGGVHKHMKRCKKRNMPVVSETAGDGPMDIPEAFIPGGGLFIERWEEWIVKQGLAPSTSHKYTLKLIQITKYFEDKIQSFLMDSLLLPLENETCLPALDGYLGDAETDNVRSLACKVYLQICDFVVHMFNERYAANKEFSIEKKQSWKWDVLNSRAAISTRIKKFNRMSAQITGLNAEERSNDKEVLLFNPQRCKDLLEQVNLFFLITFQIILFISNIHECDLYEVSFDMSEVDFYKVFYGPPPRSCLS